MSEFSQTGVPIPEPARSSVKVEANAKGDAQIKASVYASDMDPATLDALSEAAVALFVATRKRLVAAEVSVA